MTSDIHNAAGEMMRCLRHMSEDGARLSKDLRSTARRSPKGTLYYWCSNAESAQDAALQLLARDPRWPVHYKPAWLREQVRVRLLLLKDAGISGANAFDACRSLLDEFVAMVQVTKKFTVCVGVRGLVDNHFTIGRCRFERLTQERVRAGAVGNPQWVMQQPAFGKCGWNGLIGQMVCFSEVDAVDSQHAAELALAPVGEALDLLRYVQLKLDHGLGRAVPEIGLEPGDAIARSVTLVHETGTGMPAFAGEISSPFGHVQLLKCGAVPESLVLMQILSKDETARNDLENRIVRALAWIGQAALAQSGTVRFVCLTTALEAIVLLPNETKGITKHFADRVGKLLSDPNGTALARHAYDLRSACVHGRDVHLEEPDLGSWCRRVCGVVGFLLMEPRFRGLDSADALIRSL